jgi:hypothetical protein
VPSTAKPVRRASDVIALPFLAHNHTPENFPAEAALSISAVHAATAAGCVSRSGIGAPAGGGWRNKHQTNAGDHRRVPIAHGHRHAVISAVPSRSCNTA